MSSKYAPLRRSRRTRPERRESEDASRATLAKGAGNASFPEKLRMLFSEESHSVINWLSSGDAFVIADCETFVAKVLPKYFRHNNLTSFQRQLNLYGFRRVTKGDEKGAYRHKYFKRDHPELLHFVTRKARKDGAGPHESKVDPEVAPPTPRMESKEQDDAAVVMQRTSSGGNMHNQVAYQSSGMLSKIGPTSNPAGRGSLHSMTKVPLADTGIATSPLPSSTSVLNISAFSMASHHGVYGKDHRPAQTHVPVPVMQHKNIPGMYHKGVTRCPSRNSELGSDIGDINEDHDFLDLSEVDVDINDFGEIEKVFSPALETQTLENPPFVAFQVST